MMLLMLVEHALYLGGVIAYVVLVSDEDFTCAAASGPASSPGQAASTSSGSEGGSQALEPDVVSLATLAHCGAGVGNWASAVAGALGSHACLGLQLQPVYASCAHMAVATCSVSDAKCTEVHTATFPQPRLFNPKVPS